MSMSSTTCKPLRKTKCMHECFRMEELIAKATVSLNIMPFITKILSKVGTLGNSLLLTDTIVLSTHVCKIFFRACTCTIIVVKTYNYAFLHMKWQKLLALLSSDNVEAQLTAMIASFCLMNVPKIQSIEEIAIMPFMMSVSHIWPATSNAIRSTLTA